MEKKPDEVPSNPYEQPVQSNPYQQPVQSNPYEQANNNQPYQTIPERIPDGPPPAYNDHLESSSDPKQPYYVENTAFSNQAVVPSVIHWERGSMQVACPYCRKTVVTHVKTSSSVITVLLALLLAFFCLCLAVIPFCSRRCKKTTHSCPDCHHVLKEIPEFE